MFQLYTYECKERTLFTKEFVGTTFTASEADLSPISEGTIGNELPFGRDKSGPYHRIR